MTSASGNPYAVGSGLGANSTTVDGAGNLTIVNAGGTVRLPATTTVQFTDATLATAAVAVPAGTVTIAPGVAVIGRLGTTLSLRATLTYAGSFALTDAVTVDLGGFTLTLPGSVTFATGTTGSPLVTGSGGVLATSGTVAAGGFTLGGGATWSNTGAVTQTGAVQIGDSGTSTAQLRNAAGATYSLAGDIGIAAAGMSVLTNAGTLAKTSGWGISHVAVNTISTGTISVAGGNLRFDGTQNSFAGTYVGPGMIDYGLGSTSTLGTIAMIQGACSTNFGTVNQSGVVTMGEGSTIKILAGRSWTFTGDAGIALATPGTFPLLTNLGLLVKSGGTGTTVVAVDATIGGITAIASGTLSFTGAWNTFTGAVTGAGTFAIGGGSSTIAAGATVATAAFAITAGSVALGGTLAYAGSFSMGNAATLDLGGNTLALSGASLVSGTVTGAGILGVTGSLEVAGSVGGGATLQLGAAGHVQFDASQSGGTLAFGTGAQSVTMLNGATLGDTVANFAAGDTIDFAGLAFSAAYETVFTASSNGGTLSILDTAHGNAAVASLALTGNYTSGVFNLANDTGGGTTLGFTPTPSLGLSAGSVVTAGIPGSTALATVDQYNRDGSLYVEDQVTRLLNGNYAFHFAGGTFFAGRSFASFDNVTTASGTLLCQTLYDAGGAMTGQTQFNANGSTYLRNVASRPASGQVLYHYEGGSFFDSKAFSAFDNLATPSNLLLGQELYNRDGSHSFTVPGSNLSLAADHNDTFNVTGRNETVRFKAAGFGNDVFNGYAAGDVFSFATSIFADYQDLSQHVSGTGSAVITDRAGDTLTLTGVTASSLNAGMFRFA